MSLLLFILSIGFATAAASFYQQLQKSKSENKITAQRAEEADKKLRAANKKYGGLISREESIKQLDTKIIVLRDRLKQLEQQAGLQKQELKHKIDTLSTKLSELEEKDFVEDFGFYESKYDFQEATEYKHRLDEIRSEQKQLIKDKTAAVCNTEWTVAGSKREGQRMVKSFLRLVLRAFNGECDSAVNKVKYNVTVPSVAVLGAKKGAHFQSLLPNRRE